MEDYFISTNKSLLDGEEIVFLLKDCFWSKNIPIEYVHRFIEYSLCFGIYQKNTNSMIGFGRVISDYTTYAYICDVVIHAAHRQKGLAHRLVREIMAYPDLQGLKTWALRTTEEARKIYERNGFKPAEHPETQLEISDLEIYSCEKFLNLYK